MPDDSAVEEASMIQRFNSHQMVSGKNGNPVGGSAKQATSHPANHPYASELAQTRAKSVTSTIPDLTSRLPLFSAGTAALRTGHDIDQFDLQLSPSKWPSRSIPIPIPPRDTTRPITPLTAREEKGNYFPFPRSPNDSPEKPVIGRSLQPHYHPRARRATNDLDTPPSRYSPRPSPSDPPVQLSSKINIAMPREQSALYNPSSPLSPSPIMSGQPISPQQTRSSHRPPPQNLHLSHLPRFHPAVYQSPNSNSTNTLRSSRPPTSSHNRQISEPQKQIQQHQREMIVNATRPSLLITTASSCPKPTPPRLGPMGSPGPVTPLALESQGDYLLAGTSSAKLSEAQAREMVESLLQRENQRRAHPSARDGSISPAISPAGGPR